MQGYPPEPHSRSLEKIDVALPGVTGTLYVGAGYRTNPEARVLPVLCSPFNLTPPATVPPDELYRKLAQASSQRADEFGRAIHASVDEAVRNHAVVQRAGVEHPQRPPLVRPFDEHMVGPYVLYYGTLFTEYTQFMDIWQECLVCRQDYSYHVDDQCPGFLGERFSSYAPAALTKFTRLLTFANNLQAWVNKHSESILHLALERLNGKQKTGPYTGDHARGVVTPYVAEFPRRSVATTGNGPGNTVSGEPGDNGNR